MTLKHAHIFSFLSLGFIAFSFSIYLKPVFSSPNTDFEQQQAGLGRLVWQQYNCQSCHQLFGLGGYLGPDLTNVYSAPGKGEILIRAFLKSGVEPMPTFNMSEREISQLMAFLKALDACGIADPRSFNILPNAMTQRK
jgi:nitric oxide reductase subunit C